MKSMLGGLLSAGWLVEDILDLTTPQLALAGECILRHKVDMINMVMEPVVTALGSEFKSGKIAGSKARGHRKPRRTPQQRESQLLAQLASSGLPMEIERG